MRIKQIVINEELGLTVSVHSTMKMLEKNVSKGLKKVTNKLKEIGIAPSGTAFVVYSNPSKDYSEFDLEIGFPISEEVDTEGEIHLFSIPQGKGISLLHRGPYSTVPRAYHRLVEYAGKNNLDFDQMMSYEKYLNNPTKTPERHLLTEVILLIKEEANC